jgi:serine/threonine protein kinase
MRIVSASAKDGIGRDPTVLDGRSGHGGAATGPGGGPPDDALAEGHAAGEYLVERRLGSGAMGDVYAGRHPVIGKKVAIKVLKRALAGRAESAERFVREARAVNQIDHPNVVDVFAIGRLDDGRLYLVMDLLDGDSLRARLTGGALAPDVALAVLAQIAAALDAAHARGVIHRDLKPDNIVLTGPASRPTAHVLDFGIAKLVADAAGERVLETLTGQGAWLGTPAYMAPEQWSADGATAASDRYALGIVAFELLTGKPPFAATTLPGMMEQHFRAAVPSVTSTGAALRPSLDRVFARALAKEPGDRPATAADLVASLDAALGGRREVTAPSGGGRGMWIAGLAGLAVVVAGAVIVVGGVGGSASRPRPGRRARPTRHHRRSRGASRSPRSRSGRRSSATARRSGSPRCTSTSARAHRWRCGCRGRATPRPTSTSATRRRW